MGRRKAAWQGEEFGVGRGRSYTRLDIDR